MPRTLNRELVDELLEKGEGRCLSFFLPTPAAGLSADPGAIHLKNLLREAEGLLAGASVAAQEAASLLEPVHALLDDPAFWRVQGPGLAILVSGKGLWTVRLPSAPETEVQLGSRFALAPLLPMLPPAERFYVVALSLERPRVLEVTSEETRRLELPGLEGMEEALGYDQYYSDIQLHSAGSRSLGRDAAIVHGHGDSDAEGRKENVLRYFRLVAAALARRPDPEAPVVLAAVQEHEPLFRQATGDLPGLVGTVAGSPDWLSDAELAERAAAVIEERVGQAREGALERYRELGAARTCEGLEDVVPVAAQGRVDTLFFVPGQRRWGTFEPESSRPELHEEPRPGDDDLVNLAVAMALARGGTVFPVTGESAPGDSPLAAILRY